MIFALSRLRIWSRLGMAFSALLVLFVLLAGLTLWRLSELSDAFTQVVGEQAENRETIDEIADNMDDGARKLPLLLSMDREQRAGLYVEIAAADRRLDAALTLISVKLAEPHQRSALARVRESLVLYRQRFAATTALIESGRLAAAQDMLASETEAALTTLTAAIRDLDAVEQVASIYRAKSLRDLIWSDRVIVGLLCLAGVALGGLLASLVTRSIVSPLERAKRGAERLAQGDFSHRIQAMGNDEISRLSETMNVMAAAISERESRILRMANTDTLTGLPLRARFIAESQVLLTRSGAKGNAAFIVCMDIDRLKNVNSVLGFDAGDALVISASERLRASLPGDAICCRLAGGMLAACIASNDELDADAIANLVQREMRIKQVWQQQSLDLSLTAGIAAYPEHADQAELLLRRAEQAMFEAKRQRLQCAVFSPLLEESRRIFLNLLSDLQEAIDNDHLHLFLQPKVAPIDGQLRGAEALVRWFHPVRGWLLPSDFIPFAEATGRIRGVTHWMLEKAVQTLSSWQRLDIACPIAVNISTLDLQDMTFPDRVAQILRKADVPPGMLQLELTESGLMGSGEDPIRVMLALQSLGVRLAIDDFGTGQSSLAYLQRLPVHELKIDRSFVDGVDRDALRRDLLHSIVGLGHGLGLVVTAEGVENEAEMAILAASGCDLVQGYLIAKPMTIASFEAFAATARTTRHAGRS